MAEIRGLHREVWKILYHMLQTQNDSLVEMTKTFHQKYTTVIHINPSSVPSGVDRLSFNKWRTNYWRGRGKTFNKDQK